MIVFNGEVSSVCNRWYSNYIHLGILFCFLCSGTIVNIPILFLCIYWDWIWVILIIVFYLFMLFATMFVIIFPDKCKENPTVYLAIIKDTLIAKVKTKKGGDYKVRKCA